MKENFLVASKCIAYLASSVLLLVTSFIIADLGAAAVDVLVDPNYNCTPVEVKNPI